MEITQELLERIYNRATQYTITKYGWVPDKIEITDGGEIKAVYTDYRGDDDYEYISSENLTEDLEEVLRKRIAEEEAKRIAEEIKRQEENLKREIREKEQKKALYLKLKQEFEP